MYKQALEILVKQTAKQSSQKEITPLKASLMLSLQYKFFLII
jgi:hypothetical protein